jgi:hypothetical protein
MPTALTDILGFTQTLQANACIVQLIPILSQINPFLFLPHVLTSLNKQKTGTQMMGPTRHPETSVNFNQLAPRHGPEAPDSNIRHRERVTAHMSIFV